MRLLVLKLLILIVILYRTLESAVILIEVIVVIFLPVLVNSLLDLSTLPPSFLAVFSYITLVVLKESARFIELAWLH
jgi:hypothetical protein